MVAGADDHFNKALPLIECYSRVVHRVGTTPGQGQRMKVVNNALYIAALGGDPRQDMMNLYGFIKEGSRR